MRRALTIAFACSGVKTRRDFFPPLLPILAKYLFNALSIFDYFLNFAKSGQAVGGKCDRSFQWFAGYQDGQTCRRDIPKTERPRHCERLLDRTHTWRSYMAQNNQRQYNPGQYIRYSVSLSVRYARSFFLLFWLRPLLFINLMIGI